MKSKLPYINKRNIITLDTKNVNLFRQVTLIVLLLICMIFLIAPVAAGPWNASWSEYSTVTMNNTAPEEGYQVQFTNDTFDIPLSMWNVMNQNGNDTRIINYNHTIEFPHWIEHLTARDNYSIWVNVTNNDSATYRWYYDNPTASSTTNGHATFDFFDDMDLNFIQEDVDSDDYSNYPGDVVEMPNGDVWIFYSQGDSTYHDWDGDNKIMYRVSSDMGLTWGSSNLFYNESNKNDHGGVTFKEGNTVYYFWSIFESDARKADGVWMRKTTDNGSSWSNKVLVWGNDDVNEPVFQALDIIKVNTTYIMSVYFQSTTDTYTSYCIRSTDIEGTWTKGANVTVPETRGAMEPSIVELSNGNIYMSLRTKAGHTYAAISSDDTETWDSITETNIDSSESKNVVKRLSNGHLLMIWNNVSSVDITPRSPLTAGISTDNFDSFDVVININSVSNLDRLSNMGTPYELSDGTIIFGYGRWYDDSKHTHLDVVRFTENELSSIYNWDAPWVGYSSDYISAPYSKRGYTSLVTSAYTGVYGVDLSEKNNMPTAGILELNLKNLDDGSVREWFKLGSSLTIDASYQENVIFDMNNYVDRGFFRGDWGSAFAGLTDAQELYDGNWNKFKLTYTPTSSVIQVNDRSPVSLSDAESVGFPAKLGLQDTGGTTENDYLLDNVFLRKYSTTPPVVTNIEVEVPSEYIPPNPTSLANTTGNFWVNYTWSAGSGNVTDSYNVSYNGTWDNSSSNTYRNENVGAHGYLNIIVYAYNSSGTGTLSASSLTDNVTIPNNAITISNISDWSNNEGQNVYVDYDATDADSDTPTFSCNRTDLFTDFNTATGIGNWQTDYTDSGVYSVNFGVEDGYDSTSNYTMTITVADYGTIGTPTSLANTTGNFWVNYTWSAGANTDTFNVSINLTWYNGSSQAWANNSTAAHGSIEIFVYGYNSTSDQLSSSITDNVSISNNVITIINVSASYSINEGETLSIDANYSDTDNDTGTFDDNSSVWNVDANTGLVSWATSDGDDGTYNWYINVSDGYGSTSTQEFSVKVNNSIYPPELERVSFSPSPFNTNYTGTVTISYLVNSSEPLNLSTLAFVYGVNYTITGDMHNYIKVPANTLSSEGIYRAPYRNATPYLSWESNTTITNDSVWQWGGYDNDSAQLTTSTINSTHTWINVTGVTQDILPSSFYIKKIAMYDAPKTGFEINRVQGLIFKTWNLEEIRNRDANYLANMYFDSSWESTTPTDPIEIGYCNNSYDPTVDDIDTCIDCVKIGEWNGTRWVNHSYDPGVNSSYASPLVVNASEYTTPSIDDINYIWLRSYTISSKSYVLNATNYDPGITNITFAETNTMWTYNELNGQTDAIAYTPSFFTTFVRNDLDMLHQLYVANDQGDWGQTGILSEEIGISSVPVPAVSFEHFNVSCDSDYLNDTLMDATYNDGTIDIYIHVPADPDGGTVSHNLTLQYGNHTFVAIINNTFTTTGDEYVNINFDTASYYSSSDYYTLKCVSTDDEGSVATKWLVSDFTLDADGNQGFITNGKVDFWGMSDIPTLYTTISNSSLISYNAGTDIYTMHVPFFKSQYNDTFNFNETVYLKSLNNEDVAYFRFLGETVFDYANIHAWNTTSNTFAPVTDTYRGYLYTHLRVCGNITNSNMSYLGSDLYRQEGLNFIENTEDYLIHNTTLTNNAEGLIMENCANFTISNSIISNNANVGVGVYFTNNTIIENNTISSNVGYGGISVYEGFNNIIRYNDISNSGLYGIRFWSGAGNNTCTGNDITTSASYDYYYSGASFDNYLIDPASSTNLIRVTSTSSLNIENTDNAAFSEDSSNTTYAQLTNFSMYVTGLSQTFDITQHNAIITPSTDKLSIWNLEWDDTLTFNASSDTAINPTWFNITNTSWASSIINVSINGTLVTTENTDANGLLTYNYTDTYSEKWFEFQLYSSIPTPTPTPTPTVTTPPSGGSSSGTGTTGVGTSDEPLYNIDCRETSRIRNLQSGTETYYRTTKPDCTDIIKVTFTPTQNSGEQPILIEKLHNKSRFVTKEAPHLPYSYFNLYVGLFGFDEKTTNEKILFKVSKDWATTNNVTPESVTLYIFEPITTSWKSLPTTISHTDTLYYVYESESGATYGRFAIVGTDKVSLNIIEILTEKIEDIIPSINISESKFVTGATSLYNNLKEYIINLLPTSISFDTISNIFDNENTSTYIVAILTIILIAIISYFYNYEHGLIAGLIAIILMIIVTILQDTTLIKFMSVEAGNIIISTIAYTTIAFIISYIIGEKLK